MMLMNTSPFLFFGFIFACIAHGQQVTNLLSNPSFEENLKETWKDTGFEMTQYDADVVDGAYSLKCSQRGSALDGPVQDIQGLVPGGRYSLHGFVKLLDENPDKLWQAFKAIIKFSFNDTSLGVGNYIIAYRGFATAADGWITLVGNLNAPMKDFYTAQLSIRGPEAGLTFLIDNVALREVPEHPDWEATAHTNIDTHRKSNVQFQITLPEGVKANHIDIQIDHKKHLFAFGSKIEDHLARETQYEAFRSLFFYLFNWATIGSYKWRFDKGTPENPDFSEAVEATNVLLENGLKVRGHSILWGFEKNIPDWVLQVDKSQLQDVVDDHVKYMMNLAKGKLAQWDVQNEFIHGHYYEEKLHDPNVTINAFKLARSLDPVPKLYLNDFQSVTTGASTEDYHDLAMRFIAAGTGIQGLGIQGHTKDYVKPDPTMIWKRLDRLAETGLELFMTEFDLGWDDDLERADWYEDTIRAFFAHPGLSGVILWGIWKERLRYPNKYLVSGDNLQFAEPGERFACLVKKEWSTHVTKNLAQSGLTFDLRGFQGDYEVIVRNRGVPVQVETFFLGKTDTTVNITITTGKDEVAITQDHDYVPKCISHRAQGTLGSETSSSADTQLTCRSATSSAGDTAVGCDADEVLTGCTSLHNDLTWIRNGEQIVMENGRAVCKANGDQNAVRVFAVCCKVSGLTCDYRTAGPSSPMDGAQAEATCPSGYTPLGCSAYSRYPDFDGGYPDLDRNSCLAQSGAPISTNPAERSGASVSAACCTAPGLRCQVVTSDETKLSAGQRRWVACPDGYQMTGCSAFADSGKSAGARVHGRRSGVGRCRVYLGADLPKGSTGVRAVATCCLVTP